MKMTKNLTLRKWQGNAIGWAIAACVWAATYSAIGAVSVSFTRITEGAIANDRQQSMAVAWGDYDDDGDLDVYFTSTGAKIGALYRNSGAGNFERTTDAPIATETHNGLGCAWADFDNDGDLDLFRSSWIYTASALYLNNGGSFSTTPYDVDRRSMGVLWGDYDNDGFLDLIVANGALHSSGGTGPNQPEENFLYRNDGNGNRWIRVKCVGTASNRSGIGAKVRVRATIAGKTFWQLREINSGNGFCGNAIEAHFGLGDAETVDVLRVEWPSGISQELHNIVARQFLTITEPPRLGATDAGQLRLHGWKGRDGSNQYIWVAV